MHRYTPGDLKKMQQKGSQKTKQTSGRSHTVERFSGPEGSLMHQLLPYPPSVNSVWRVGPNGIYLTGEGYAYRRAVVQAVAAHRNALGIEHAIKLVVKIYPPDKRRRDIDNIFKSLLDALMAAKVYADDSLIKCLDVEMCERVVKHGAVIVSIYKHKTQDESEINERMLAACSFLISAYPDR